MGIISRIALKNIFKTGNKPAQKDFGDMVDSLMHREDSIAISRILGLQERLNSVLSNEEKGVILSGIQDMDSALTAIKKSIPNVLTPEIFGAVGDGVTDDYRAIQDMLDAGPEGCTFSFDGSKTYYNAFANDGKWVHPPNRNIWTRKKGATFNFNGAKLRRRMPKWADANNASGNAGMNEGEAYTDELTSLLYIERCSSITINNADFHGGNQKGNMRNLDASLSGNIDYAVGEGWTNGLWLESCENVEINGGRFAWSTFPVYIRYCKNVKVDNVQVQYAAQAWKRIRPADPATGAGMKLISNSDVKITNLQGYRNANATLEIEPYNRNVYAQGWSELDYDTSATILASSNVEIDWLAKNVTHGPGVIIKHGNNPDVPTQNIRGRIVADNNPWAGVLIHQMEGQDISDVALSITTRGSGHAGFMVQNETPANVVRNLNISHVSENDGWGDGWGLLVIGKAEGRIVSTVSNITKGAKIAGSSTEKPLSVKLITDSTVGRRWDVSGSNVRKEPGGAEWIGTERQYGGLEAVDDDVTYYIIEGNPNIMPDNAWTANGGTVTDKGGGVLEVHSDGTGGMYKLFGAELLVPGKTYTFSFSAIYTAEFDAVDVITGVETTGTTRHKIKKQWTNVEFTQTLSAQAGDRPWVFYLGSPGTVQVKNIKVEEGSIAT